MSSKMKVGPVQRKCLSEGRELDVRLEINTDKEASKKQRDRVKVILATGEARPKQKFDETFRMYVPFDYLKTITPKKLVKMSKKEGSLIVTFPKNEKAYKKRVKALRDIDNDYEAGNISLKKAGKMKKSLPKTSYDFKKFTLVLISEEDEKTNTSEVLLYIKGKVSYTRTINEETGEPITYRNIKISKCLENGVEVKVPKRVSEKNHDDIIKDILSGKVK